MNPGVWDARYGSQEYVYGALPNAWVNQAAEQHLGPGPLTVVELASGEGRNAVYLAEVGPP
jgi:hypothetical protein